MIHKSNSKKRSKSKSSPSATKIIQNSHSKNINPQSTYISASQSPHQTTGLKQTSQKYDLSHKKTKQNIYSKSKSEASFAKSQKKSVTSKSTCHEKQSLSRLLQKPTCQKHQPWFNCNDDYPFKTQVKAQMPSDIYSQQKWQRSKEQKFQRLIEDLRKKHMTRFEQKIVKEKDFIQKTCSFLPNKQKVMLSEHNPEIHQSLFLRFKQVQQKQRLNEQSKILQQRQLLENYEKQRINHFNESKKKWQMLLNTEVKKHHYEKPIYERLEFIKDDKKELLQKLKAKYSLKQSPLKNMKMDQEQSLQLVKRLCDDYRIKRKQHEAEVEQKINKQMKINYPFTPIVNQTDLHRQTLNPINKKTSPEKNRENFTFVPKIDDMSKIIAQKLQSKYGSHYDHYMLFPQRLSQGIEQKIAKVDQISNQMYSECTFKPEINQISKELVYVKNYEGQPLNSHKCPLPQSIIQEEKQLTFKPQINSQSKCMTWMQKEELLMRTKQKSKEKSQKIQTHKQYKQMEQCTFQPKTVSTSADWKVWKENNLKKQKLKCVPFVGSGIYSDRENPQHCQTVKGLNKFIKNCENIKKKKESHAERLNKIFNFQQRYDERIKKQRLLQN